MTLDTTRAVINLNKTFYEFIDVPGHKELIKNMLTGASEARFAIMMIDVNEGIRPQTLKHLEIAEFLGIEKLIIAVNKVDTTGYSQTRFEKAKKIFLEILKNNGFAKKVSIIPISAFSGNNLIHRTSALNWYKGPVLCNAVVKEFTASRKNIVSSRQNKTSTIRPVCIFINAPRKSKLILESATEEATIRSVGGYQKIHSFQQMSLKLSKPLLLGNKFVIKQNGRIIGICKRIY